MPAHRGRRSGGSPAAAGQVRRREPEPARRGRHDDRTTAAVNSYTVAAWARCSRRPKTPPSGPWRRARQRGPRAQLKTPRGPAGQHRSTSRASPSASSACSRQGRQRLPQRRRAGLDTAVDGPVPRLRQRQLDSISAKVSATACRWSAPWSTSNASCADEHHILPGKDNDFSIGDPRQFFNVRETAPTSSPSCWPASPASA
jgi:hypothetical protein